MQLQYIVKMIMYINRVCDVFNKLIQGSKETWKG